MKKRNLTPKKKLVLNRIAVADLTHSQQLSLQAGEQTEKSFTILSPLCPFTFVTCKC
ncbi:class I lanthipeptide [Chitinophaga nivalis]|uniref:class I lanthipeptide n=1 Tax=Chitinophaga nivalis TaxID=2991709 RepID=UPI00353178CB